MTDVLIRVDGMTCEHCNMAVERAIGALGAERVSADFNSGRVTAIFLEEPDEAAIRAAIEEEGYELVSVTAGSSG
jgi:copper chaperone